MMINTADTCGHPEARLHLESLNHRDTLIESEPFPFLVARHMVAEELSRGLASDFPVMKGAGYLPYESDACGPAINQLVDQLVAPDFADALGNALGINRLSQYPTYISIAGSLNKRHGKIHTDGKSKIATLLLYLNDQWSEGGAGCLRFLKHIDDINDTIVPEIPPIYGTLVAFKRAENSFHGHLPFEGERRVIQVAWLASLEDKLRKSKRGKLSHKIKGLFGWADRKLGSGRGDNAYSKVRKH